MKTRTLIGIIYSVTFAAIAVWLLLERRACAQIHEENTVLLRRLNEATEKLAENQRLPERTAPATDNLSDAGAPLATSPAGADEELLRLRSEIAGLLQQHQQTESLLEDTRQTRAALENRRKEDRAARRAANGNVSQLEIIKAEYWTDHTRMDVTGELQDRIRGDSLKAMASNNIKGDPEFGQTKHLTIEYRFGGVTRTNEFREGDVIVLPAE
ncbi:MAG TPA: hypothetical protein VNZ64_03820 [Candidatus Acidoferrum sp.]|jgi:hypothetical protein|nr:hypothetical protein [Candidatus Acidoferrum sp.]